MHPIKSTPPTQTPPDPTMEEMLIIPRAEAPHLVSHYGQKLMENDRLKTAATLAAKKHRILHDPTLTDNAKVALLTPVNRRLRQSKKRLRQVSLSTAGPGDDDDDDDDNDMSTPAAEKIMRKLVKAVKTPPPKAKPKVPPRPSFAATPKRPPLSLSPEDILLKTPKPKTPLTVEDIKKETPAYQAAKAAATPKAPKTATPKTPKTLEEIREYLQGLPSGVTTRAKAKKDKKGEPGPSTSTWDLKGVKDWEEY